MGRFMIMLFAFLLLFKYPVESLYSVAVLRHSISERFAMAVLDIISDDDREWYEAQDWQEVETRSYDGLKLAGYFLENEDPTENTAIVFHGFSSNHVMSVPYARMFSENGWNVLLIDQRSHGKSEGEYITYGYYERHDVGSWVDYVVEERGDDCVIALHGTSMGSASVLQYLGEYSKLNKLPKNVKVAISDCGYTSADEIFTQIMEEIIHLPQFLYMPAVETMIEHYAEFKTDDVSSIDVVPYISIPVMFVHGDSDYFIPVEMGIRLYEAKNGDKKLYIAHGANHGLSFNSNPEEYERQAMEFVNEFVT